VRPARPEILHVLSGDVWGGAEAQACALLRTLRERGRVEVSALLFNEGVLGDRLRGSGVAVDVVSERAHGFAGLARGAIRTVRGRNPAILHGHGYKENLVACLAARGRPLVRTQHGSPFPGGRFPYGFYYALDRFLARRVFARTIAVSAFVETELARFLPPDRIARIRNGVAPPAVAAPEALPFARGSRIVVSGGRLSAEKRFDRLIDAVALVARHHPNVRLVLLGDGPERGGLERRAEEQAPGLVLFAGFQADPWAHLLSGTVFALASDREGLPMVLLEAMALGLPAVATAVGGIPEVVRDGETGLLVSTLTADAMAEAIGRLLGDDSLRLRLAAAGRQLVLSEFGVDRTAEETERLYGHLLGKP
jgi:glycosyltransferase involved in cell wall biosynthesis